METIEKTKDNIADKYDLLIDKFKEYYVHGKEHGRESLAAALESSRDYLTSAGELGLEQGHELKLYLARDLEQTIADTDKLSDGLNPSRLRAGTMSLLASILDSTGSAIDSLRKKTAEKLIFKTGEVTSAGTLSCQKCQQKIHLKSTKHIPPCPKCHATVFHKGY
jgi:hypothetical protein